jgi:hypothetical protein
MKQLTLPRRTLLTSLAAGLPVVSSLSAVSKQSYELQASAQSGEPQMSLFRDLIYFDQHGVDHRLSLGQSSATADYVNSLTAEEFLRRHWNR